MKTQGYTIKPKEKPFKAEKFKVKYITKARTNKPDFYEATRNSIREAKDVYEYHKICKRSEERNA